MVVGRVLGQLVRAVKAIDSKSIGATRVSSSLTAVDVLTNKTLADACLQLLFVSLGRFEDTRLTVASCSLYRSTRNESR